MVTLMAITGTDYHSIRFYRQSPPPYYLQRALENLGKKKNTGFNLELIHVFSYLIAHLG